MRRNGKRVELLSHWQCEACTCPHGLAPLRCARFLNHWEPLQGTRRKNEQRFGNNSENHFDVILRRFWVSFWGSSWGYVGVKLGSCWGHFGVSNKVPYKNRFLEASWSPSRAQVGLQVGPSCAQNRYLTSLKFRLRFRRDLEASRARFW